MRQNSGAIRMALIALVVGLCNAIYTTVVMVNTARHQDALSKQAQVESKNLTGAINKLADVLEKQNQDATAKRTSKGD